MGRIEDALAKIQASGSLPSRGGSTRPLGRVADTAVPRLDHAYGGKPIEIDMAELHRLRLLAPDSHERRLADEYRQIKRPLLINASRVREPVLERGNLLMVGSAMSGEGKTFTCLNLCLSIAREKDWDVVLVDGDCNKPQLTRLFGSENELGLLDLLRDPELTFDSLVMPTNLPGLSLLPAGKRDEQASELLASARMSTLCAQISNADAQRVIVFDSAPLLLTSEAPVLATQVGQILLVVHANRTPQQAVLRARDLLDQSKAINVVLNQVAATSDVLGSYGDYQTYPQ